jgi:hypothetical protein
MKLIIELDIDNSDFSEGDVGMFMAEANSATGLTVEVGRPVEHAGTFRTYTLSTEYFKVRTEGI